MCKIPRNSASATGGVNEGRFWAHLGWVSLKLALRPMFRLVLDPEKDWKIPNYDAFHTQWILNEQKIVELRNLSKGGPYQYHSIQYYLLWCFLWPPKFDEILKSIFLRANLEQNRAKKWLFQYWDIQYLVGRNVATSNYESRLLFFCRPGR